MLTISVDHRVVDGSVAAEFMQELKRLLQAPMGLFGVVRLSGRRR